MMKIQQFISRITRYKKYIVCVLIVIGLSLTVYETISYLISDSSLNNQFTIASVTPEIKEVYDYKNTKQNVQVTNNGDIPIYVRVKVMIYFKDANENIIGDKPIEGTDYNLSGKNTSEWKEINGYYYYLSPLEVNGCTKNLFDEFMSNLGVDDDRTLVVDIACQSIQASSDAIDYAWPDVQVDDNGQLVERVDEP